MRFKRNKGNLPGITYNLEFQLSEWNTYIPENGVIKFPLEQWLEGVWVTGKIVITSNGKCKIVLHGQYEL